MIDHREQDSRDFDVAIVGAGPAAATFASEAARSGLRFLLIDGQSVSPNKPCGGLLAPDAQRLLAEYDFVLPKDILVSPQIFSVKTIDLTSGIVRSYQRHYLNMDRRAFDKHLLSLVPDNVTRLRGRCTSLQRETAPGGMRFRLDVTCEDGTRRSFRARVLVGADGASSLVRRTFYDVPIRKYLAIQQWFRLDEPGKPYYSCIFDKETSDNCSWTIAKDGYFIYGGCFDKKYGRRAFERQKERLCAFLGKSLPEPEYTEACLACSPQHGRDFVTGANGVWLIGEAAGFISASSLEGISSAIKSGSLLADAFLSEAPTDDDAISRRYRASTRKLRFKLIGKIFKHKILFTPWTRTLIMKSGLSAIRTKR